MWYTPEMRESLMHQKYVSQLAQSLDLEIISEGVETTQQADFLIRII